MFIGRSRAGQRGILYWYYKKGAIKSYGDITSVKRVLLVVSLMWCIGNNTALLSNAEFWHVGLHYYQKLNFSYQISFVSQLYIKSRLNINLVGLHAETKPVWCECKLNKSSRANSVIVSVNAPARQIEVHIVPFYVSLLWMFIHQ